MDHRVTGQLVQYAPRVRSQVKLRSRYCLGLLYYYSWYSVVHVPLHHNVLVGDIGEIEKVYRRRNFTQGEWW